MKNDPRSCERNICHCVRSQKKIQDFYGIWTRDLAIPVRCSNKLSCEGTDVGSWSIMCLYDLFQMFIYLFISCIFHICVHNCKDHSSFDFISAVLI